MNEFQPKWKTSEEILKQFDHIIFKSPFRDPIGKLHLNKK
jgi:hypothetical protein